MFFFIFWIFEDRQTVSFSSSFAIFCTSLCSYKIRVNICLFTSEHEYRTYHYSARRRTRPYIQKITGWHDHLTSSQLSPNKNLGLLCFKLSWHVDKVYNKIDSLNKLCPCLSPHTHTKNRSLIIVLKVIAFVMVGQRH